VGFLKRLLGGAEPKSEPAPPLDDAQLEAEEAAYERELLRDERERMSDLTRRQLRYADHAWKPPDQGGARRAEDRDEGTDAPTDDG
jgi:hypothetical protein